MPNYVIPSGRVLTTGDFLEVAVRKAMSPGVVSISADASLEMAYESMVVHRIHAILVVGDDRTPLGWATAKGMLAFCDRDRSLVTARDAITEEAQTIERNRSVRDAIALLSGAEITHLIVVDEGGGFPIGTLSDIDLAAFLGHKS
jgi:CBS-domain-containing membrane protein